MSSLLEKCIYKVEAKRFYRIRPGSGMRSHLNDDVVVVAHFETELISI